MESCILGAKKLIEEQVNKNRISYGIAFKEFHKTYCWTNENIYEYLKLASFEGKDSALSVMASGDQVFNLVCKGINNIDAFDVNRLTEFFALGLKRAMILKYDYYDFLLNMKYLCLYDDITIEYISELIKGLFPYMESEHRIFWEELIDYNYKIQKGSTVGLNLIQMLTVGYMVRENRINYNTYLQDEESYNRLKQNLVNANIIFKCANAVELHEEFSGKYDFILLSNILDYFKNYWGPNWTYANLKKYICNLESISNSGGTIFLHYLFDGFAAFDDTIFGNSVVYNKDLEDEELHVFKNGNFDGMLLKRVK